VGRLGDHPVGSAVSSAALALDAASGTLYVGGGKLDIDSSTWSALGSGMGGDVYALALDAASGVLYLGGDFTSAGGDTGIKYLAKFDVASSTFSALGAGLDNVINAEAAAVFTLALDAASGVLYAGGNFNREGLAKFDIASSIWSAVGGGLPIDYLYGGVYALALDAASGALYVGGTRWSYDVAGGDTGIHYLAKFDTASSTFSALPGGGVSSDVRVLLRDAESGVLYVGGDFTSAGGVSGTQRLAKFDIASSTWSALGGGMSGANHVYALALDAASGVLSVGGGFTSAGGSSEGLTTFDIASSTWSAVQSVPSDDYVGRGAMALVIPTCAAGNVPTISGGACTPCRPGWYVKDYGSNRR